LLLAGGCRLPAADHERLGDDAYAAARFDEAAGEYQAAQRVSVRSRVWAKAGAAALHAGKFADAIAAYRSLAEADPTRATEAAVGIERTIEAATRGRADPTTISRGVLALRAVSPARAIGQLARLPIGDTDAPTTLGLMPSALAAAGTKRAVDSLLMRYADAFRTTTACDAAARGYQSVLRRSTQGPIVTAAKEGLAFCALQLGTDALSAQEGERAEYWFGAVLQVDPASERGLRAQIGRGDALLLLGDALGASVAYQAVLGARAVPDSLRTIAAGRLNSLGSASPGGPSGDA
jgi:tetratricopeptide (TPR) repeat protein